MPTHIYMYDNHSETGNEIRERLGLLRIRHEGSTFRGREDLVVLNWGCSDLPASVRRSTVINTDRAVYNAVNKLRAFRHLEAEDVRIPEYTADYTTARDWVFNDGPVYERQRLMGHDGQGCRYIEDIDQLNPDARLWTRALDVRHEFRITMFGDVMVGCQWKVPDGTQENPDQHIRTTAGGWGFRPVRNERNLVALSEIADDARMALGLDFGGVDIVKTQDGEFYVLEVNTAPVMTPYVMDNFCNELRLYD